MPFFSCRVCAGTPWGSLFGQDSSSSDEPVGEFPEDTSAEESHEVLSNNTFLKAGMLSGHVTGIIPASPSGIDYIYGKWKPHIQQRAHDLWQEHADEQVSKLIKLLVQGVGNESDPVFGSSSDCVEWDGERDVGNHPVLPFLMEQKVIMFHVHRVLAFLILDDPIFDSLFENNTQQTNEGLETTCGNSNCVSMKHVVGVEDSLIQEAPDVEEAPDENY